MNKEEYFNHKKNGNWMKLYFEYWAAIKPSDYTNLSEEDFTQLFQTFLNNFKDVPISTLGGPKIVTLDKVQQKVVNYFETKLK